MKAKITFLTVFLFTLAVPGAWANTDNLKTYRKVYPDLKPSCLYCHLDKVPKKEDGKHEPNAYGKWLKELAGEGEITEEVITKAGRHDEFEVKAAEEGGAVTETGTAVETEAEPAASEGDTEEVTE